MWSAEMQEVHLLRDDDAHPVVRLCPVCHGAMRTINVESVVAGLPAAMKRRTIKCPVCEFTAVHTFAHEDGW
jgi:hypothetical protein